MSGLPIKTLPSLPASITTRVFLLELIACLLQCTVRRLDIFISLPATHPVILHGCGMYSPQNHVSDSIQRNTQQGRASFFLFRKTINVYIIYTTVLAGS